MNNCGKNIILFDSDCVLCSRSISYIFNRDERGKFKFSSLSSFFSQKIIENHPELNQTDTVVLWREGKIYTKSDAVIQILEGLGIREKIAAKILKLLPKFYRNALYDWVARNRKQKSK
jgi:predicted DCC family thiol-disulfide oxidoreductase YuxK